MANETKQLVDLLTDRRKEILDNWVENVYSKTGVRIKEMMAESMYLNQAGEELDAFIAVIREDDLENEGSRACKALRSLLREISTMRAELGFSASETASDIFSLKDVLFEYFQSAYVDDPVTLTREVLKTNKLIDWMGLITFENYAEARERVIQHQSHALREISTPVIKAWDGIVLLPLVGIIDTARAQEMIEGLLQGIVKNEARVAVIDISGVPVIDTRVAQHLIKTVTASTMLGAQVIMTGISPEIAQTIIKLDIDLSAIRTRGSLKAGIEEAFNIIGLEIFKHADMRDGVLEF